jgi:hypothetical protein
MKVQEWRVCVEDQSRSGLLEGEEKPAEALKGNHFVRVSGLFRKVENTFGPVH